MSLLPNKLEDGYDFALTPDKIRSLHKRLMYIGFTYSESANIVARMMGLDVSKNWTVEQLIAVHFLAYLNQNDKILH